MICQPQQLFTSEQTRQLDRLAIAAGTAGYTLMKRAGQSAFDLLRHRWPDATTLHILCGCGNNGGDGFAIASIAIQAGLTPVVYVVGDSAKIANEAALAFKAMQQQGIGYQPLTDDSRFDHGVIVDALLGTGLSGTVRPAFAAAIALINRSELPVLAIDVPSGLCGDSGQPLGAAVTADVTLSFIGAKRGLYQAGSQQWTGQRLFDDLSIPTTLYPQAGEAIELLDLEQLKKALPKRAADSNKGSHGHVLVVGGNHGYGGAALMAAEAALRAGAGLVSVATQAEHIAPYISRRPELMVSACDDTKKLSRLLAAATAVAIGPGLGQDDWSKACLRTVLASDKTLLLDADALNIIAADPRLLDHHTGQRIITPHPGEAGRLLNLTTAEVQADRDHRARQLSRRYGAVTVLKGASSLVAHDRQISLCPDGNPYMASGGMGDVLSGIIVSLVAQGLDSHQATKLGVSLHACAADYYVQQQGGHGMVATDVITAVTALLNRHK
ncbi:Bifunctional NAD(P)H-hydrate repair enzyme Nnr [Sinobacterium norvegicum]|uniref:Bifunctional NAD(P)H-hydrate repair enzyme n=2 Tax=Sinobacterium norvegicum TaxID=1641715 RepID=A0ABM9AGS3_9GAMM|nr:Bifunctional NAD(P)H-hydrate repair enzyme Nnr [Sinobacterium norvegicum]